jgi:hypothetical protein
MTAMKHVILTSAALLGLSGAAMAASPPSTLKDGTIGYAMVSLHWATYQTADGKAECPQGFNTQGPRETFKALYPQDKGEKWRLVESHIKREIAGWYPETNTQPFPYLEAQGKVAYGLNLDGKTGPNDFESPDGAKGVDNQLYRALGCSNHYRGPDGQTDFFDSKAIVDDRYNRNLVELTGVDSLVNDDDVQVTLYRGLDRLLTDATGNTIMPGGSQRIDIRRGARFVHRLHGRIKDGVLTTDPQDVVFPWSTFGVATVQIVKAMRFEMKVMPDGAEGLMAGYTDLDNFYSQMMKSESTHHQSYGQLSPPDMARVLAKLADGYPDPKTGKMTAISSALKAKYTQVYIVHPEKTIADAAPARAESGKKLAEDARR